MQNLKGKQRCLFGIFPVWMEFYDCKGNQINVMTGFWSDIALALYFIMYEITYLLSFGNIEIEGFAFYPYQSNGCRYWHQAIWKVLLTDEAS